VKLSLGGQLECGVIAPVHRNPAGCIVGLDPVSGRSGIIVALKNAMMGLPPVVVGLAVFLALSRSGPLGSWDSIHSPSNDCSQTILVTDIRCAGAPKTSADLGAEYRDNGRHEVGSVGAVCKRWCGKHASV